MTILSNKKIVEIDGEKWKPMSGEEVEAAIVAEPPDSDCPFKRYHCYQKYYEWELEEDRFLSIIWLNIPETGPLTPDGEPRTIRDVAERMIIENYDFQSLIESRYPWYCRCCKIKSKGFDYAKFGTIWLKGATLSERGESRPGKYHTGKYHIAHGAHRSIVLGQLLKKGEIEYQPVRAILVKNPRSKHPHDVH